MNYTPAEIASIAARIAGGEGKSEIVTTMPYYSARHHRKFAAFYDSLYTGLVDQGLVIPKKKPRKAKQNDIDVAREAKAITELVEAGNS